MDDFSDHWLERVELCILYVLEWSTRTWKFDPMVLSTSSYNHIHAYVCSVQCARFLSCCIDFDSQILLRCKQTWIYYMFYILYSFCWSTAGDKFTSIIFIGYSFKLSTYILCLYVYPSSIDKFARYLLRLLIVNGLHLICKNNIFYITINEVFFSGLWLLENKIFYQHFLLYEKMPIWDGPLKMSQLYVLVIFRLSIWKINLIINQKFTC